MRAAVRHAEATSADDTDARKWASGHGLGSHQGSRFGGPHFLARDSKGRIYTTEGTMGRVQQFSPDGKPLLAWGDKGDQHGGFGAFKAGFSKNSLGPIGVFVDRKDRVCVSVSVRRSHSSRAGPPDR